MNTRLGNIGRNKSEGPGYEYYESRVVFVTFVPTGARIWVCHNNAEYLEQQHVHEFCYCFVNFGDWKCACSYIWTSDISE